MKALILTTVFTLFPALVSASPVVVARSLSHADSAISASKLKSAAAILRVSVNDLKLGTKAENIQDLFDIVIKEKKLTYGDQFKYLSIFQSLPRGDEFLLKCLKQPRCDFEKHKKLAPLSSLHKEFALKNPAFNITKLNHQVGTLNENLMRKYFNSTGWTRIEGEVGRNGIDGLFIKRNNRGHIVDVFIVESKYNKSMLQKTNSGQQMTKEWILKKVSDLKSKHPESKDYDTIKTFIENDTYRAGLWHLELSDSKLLISLKKVHDKKGSIKTADYKAGEKMKINYNGNQVIDLENPDKPFHARIAAWYMDEVNSP